MSPIVKWLSLLTLNQASGVRIAVGEVFVLLSGFNWYSPRQFFTSPFIQRSKREQQQFRME